MRWKARSRSPARWCNGCATISASSSSRAEIETLARSVEDNGDVYFVPAFSGLYAPHWKEHARGVIAGLTRFANKGHIARAALEATAYQTRDVLDAMEKDSGVAITELRVDGGMVVNELLMQFQADILDVPVVRPQVIETTALGAAYAAGLAVGYWHRPTTLSKLAREHAGAPRWTTAQARRTLSLLEQGGDALARLGGIGPIPAFRAFALSCAALGPGRVKTLRRSL